MILVSILGLGFLGGLFFGNYEEIVTSRLYVGQLEEVIEKNSEQFLRSVIVESENDEQLNSMMLYLNEHYGNLNDLEANITSKTLLYAGPRACIFIPDANEQNFNTRCVDQEDGRVYANYIIELEITYDDDGETATRNESGLLVFVKSDNWFDIFTWRMVRFHRVVVEA